jgi:hypothetical protein
MCDFLEEITCQKLFQLTFLRKS